jgi:hypothetical protein
MTMTNSKRNADRDDTTPAQPSPNPKAKKKNKEHNDVEKSDETADSEDESRTEDSSQVENLASRFEEEAAAVAGTLQLWTQSILYPTTHWKTLKIDSALTGFSPDEVFGEGETVHNLSRLGIIIRCLDAKSSLTAAGWRALFEEAFTKETPLQQHAHIKRLKTFGIRLALSNPRKTFDPSAWIGTALRAREDTNAWTGAYLLFGAPWNLDKAKFFTTTSNKPNSTTESSPVDLTKTPIPESPNVDLTNAHETDSEEESESAPSVNKEESERASAEPTKLSGHGSTADSTSDTEMNANDMPPKAPPKRPPKKVAFQIRNFFLSKSILPPKAKPKSLSKAQERKYNTFFKIQE